MRRLSTTILCGLLSCLVVAPGHAGSGKAATGKPPVQAAPPVLTGDAGAGRLKSDDERCQECHGHDGNANDIEDGIGNVGKFPRLAGQNAAYLSKQFIDFRTGQRRNDTMSVMARSVSDADLADIAAYFSSQKALAGEAGSANPQGRNLFLNGDPARGILPCAGCHAAAEKTAAPGASPIPRLAGQHRRYLQKQLSEWRAGERHNSPGGVMNAVAQPLSDDEIDALADYLASL